MRFLVLALLLWPACAIGQASSSSNMTLLAHHDLGGRPAYQPVVHRHGDRWLAYVGHHASGDAGTSILDVTDVRAPKLLAHIPARGGAQMVRVCEGRTLPRADRAKVYLLRTLGDEAHEVWDVTRPEQASRVSVVARGLSGTHKNWWECDSGIAYLVSGVPGWRTSRMTQVVDLADPAHPRLIREFGLVGQQPGARGPVPTGLHGAISTGVKGNRVYFGYGTNRAGVMQIVDRRKLLEGPAAPTPENLLAPQVGRLDLPSHLGAHTVFPILGVPVAEFAADAQGATRDLVLIVNEQIASNCREARQMVWLADVTDEAHPMTISGWTVPQASGNFCARGRFGAHSSNESFTPAFYKRLVFIAFFNAGVRVLDIRDPLRPREVAFYVPGGDPVTNNVEVDDRGYAYIVDREGGGLHILALAGEARAIANLP